MFAIEKYKQLLICLLLFAGIILLTYKHALNVYFTKPTSILTDFESLQERKRLVYRSNYTAVAPSVAAELGNRLRSATEKKTIIIWYPPFGAKSSNNLNVEECGNCAVTYDTSKINDNSTAAIIFHFNEITPQTMPPLSNRNYDQLYIFWTLEAPPALLHYRERTLEYEDQYGFNASFSYRRDSDFYITYGTIESKRTFLKEALNSSIENILKFKKKTALTLVSNCEYTPGAVKRLKILNEVITIGFSLEAYGACFSGNGNFPKDAAMLERVKEYKFYFSFENSYHCRDYITEKYFSNAINSVSVPVVWGATKKDYATISPPGSFIHVEDFASSKELVDYLNYLDKNDTAYLEYFRWFNLTEDEMKYAQRKYDVCQICRAVHGINVDDIYNSKYDPDKLERPLFSDKVSRRTLSLRKWFYDSENKECLYKMFDFY